MPGAAKISFAFLSHRAHEQQGTGGFNLHRLESICYRNQRDETAAIIGNSRRQKFGAFASNCDIGSCRKNGIKMCAYYQEWRSRVTFSQRNTVSLFIELCIREA